MSSTDAFVVIILFTAFGALVAMAIGTDHLVGAGVTGGILGFVVGLVACIITNSMNIHDTGNQPKDTTKK